MEQKKLKMMMKERRLMMPHGCEESHEDGGCRYPAKYRARGLDFSSSSRWNYTNLVVCIADERLWQNTEKGDLFDYIYRYANFMSPLDERMAMGSDRLPSHSR